MELGADLMLLLLDGLKEQGAAGDVNVSQDGLPVPAAHVCLFDQEGFRLCGGVQEAARRIRRRSPACR